MRSTSASGTVTRVAYTPGRFLPAYRHDAGTTNERSEIWIEHRGQTIVARQIVGMLARRVVCRLAVGKLDHPLIARYVDQSFGASAAHGRARGNQSLLRLRNGFVVLHLANELLNLIGVSQRRQGSQSPRQVVGRRC